MAIFKKLEAVVARIMGWDEWHVSTRGQNFVEKRYNRSSMIWEIRPLKPEQENEAFAYWSIR